MKICKVFNFGKSFISSNAQVCYPIPLNKAFDTVSRDGLWKILAKFGCPPRYIAM